MSESARVQAWRNKLREAGLVPMTIWVKPETKARYEDLAVQSRHSVSELALLALEAYRGYSAPLSATIADNVSGTEELRALIREEIAQAIPGIAATVTATVTDTIKVLGQGPKPQKAPTPPKRAPATSRRMPQETADRITALHAEGLTPTQIVDRLTAEGIPTVHGGPWHRGTVGKVVQGYSAGREGRGHKKAP